MDHGLRHTPFMARNVTLLNAVHHHHTSSASQISADYLRRKQIRKMSNLQLLSKLVIGEQELKNRVILAPLTRAR